MANETITTTQAANHLVTEYRPGFMTAANEEMVLAKHFMDATEGAQKLNNALVIRIIAAAAAQSAAGTATLTARDLTFNQTTETSKTCSPSFIYSGVQINYPAMLRVRDDAQQKAAYKKQIVASLATQIDVTSAVLIASLGTNIVVTVNVDKASILDCIGLLVQNGRDHFKIGKTEAHFVLYNKQAKNLMNIPDLTSAYVRGDKANPIVSGWVFEALNSTFEESGNIYAVGGTAHNAVVTDGAFAIAYGLKPMLLDPQPDGAVIRFLAIAEHGEVEVFDEYAVDYQSTSA